MTHDPGSSSEREKRLNEVLAAYLEAAQAGQQVNQEEWLARHPDLAGELAEFFANQERVGRLAAPLRSAISPDAPPTQEDPTLPPEPNAANGPPLGTKVRYFGDYELLEEIARGGMGVVYKARQASLNRIVAVKMILAGQLASESDIRRFRIEAEAAANLDHPNIVPIYEVGEHEGQHYFSMKLVAGPNLATRLADGPLPNREAAELLRTVALGVQHAHEQGVIHRDLKPANLLFAADGQPMVTDFGLAKKLDEVGQTATGAVMGTPSYMAPEQASGRAKQLGPAADVYALGAILYECLTGRPPFQAATTLDTIMQVLTDDPKPPRQRNARIDPDLEAICLKCLAKAPGERYGSALALAEDLGRFCVGDRPIHARPLNEWQSAVRWARKSRATAILTLLAGSAMLLVYVAMAAYDVAHRSIENLNWVVWVPGFLAVMAIVVRPRIWVACFSLLFLVITFGVPWVAWEILAKSGATVHHARANSDLLDRLAYTAVAGVISAGFFGVLSREIARWHRCDMLTVFFGGVAGAALTNLMSLAFSPIYTFVGFFLGTVLTGQIISRRRTLGSVFGGAGGDVAKSLPEKLRSDGAALAVYAIITGGFCGGMGLFLPGKMGAFYHGHVGPSTPSGDLLDWLPVVITIKSLILILAGCLLFINKVVVLRSAQILLVAGILGFVLEGVLAALATQAEMEHPSGSTSSLIILFTGPIIIMAVIWTVFLPITVVRLGRYLKDPGHSRPPAGT
jgi:tRNA A-37 threonylcarbamoyl transferase component Bud32